MNVTDTLVIHGIHAEANVSFALMTTSVERGARGAACFALSRSTLRNYSQHSSKLHYNLLTPFTRDEERL